MFYNQNMLKRAFGLILLIVILCIGMAGCDMLNDILSNKPNNAQAGANGENQPDTDADTGDSSSDASADDDVFLNSRWVGDFAADGSYFSINEVNETAFQFLYVDLYEQEELRGEARFKDGGAVYSNLTFRLDGNILKVTYTVKDEDSEELIESSVEYWRAFKYREIDPLPLEEDAGMIPQKDALKEITAALKGELEEGMFLKPAGAVEIDKQPCWTFTVGHGFDVKFAGGNNYAISRDGRVFVRNDYLLQYVIMPYLQINTEKFTSAAE